MPPLLPGRRHRRSPWDPLSVARPLVVCGSLPARGAEWERLGSLNADWLRPEPAAWSARRLQVKITSIKYAGPPARRRFKGDGKTLLEELSASA